MNERGLKYRLASSAVVLVCAMVGLGYRLAFLHVGMQEAVLEGIRRAREVETVLLAGRGSICDRRGRDNILAINLTVKDVCAEPRRVVEDDSVVQSAVALSEILGIPVDEVAARLNRPTGKYVRIQRFVEEERIEQIRAAGLAHVFFEDSTVRYYPQRSSMCHVLGFVNHEGVGSAGIELATDKYLRGSSGLLHTRVNAKRQEMYVHRQRYIPALKGAEVELALDQNIQYIVESALESVMKEHHAQGACAVVQYIPTGEILAMASLPHFDLNEFTAAEKDAMRNRAIADVYEPGSTMKALVMASALDQKTVTPQTVFSCEDGAWSYSGRLLRDFHPYGDLTVADGLKKSSNILTAKVAVRMGEDALYKSLRSFGIGSRTGLDLPAEEWGILHPVSKWSGISVTRVAIGQGVAVTAVQMLNAFCAIANGGRLMRPYVVRRVTAPDGSTILENRPEVVSQPISPETSAVMCRLLARVTEDGGTGTRARVEGYGVAGKTGTAQKPENGGYSSSRHVASFVGFLPADAPEIGLIVVVDEPQPIHTGGRVAAPAFAEIAEQTVRYLDIAPPSQDVAGVPDVEG